MSDGALTRPIVAAIVAFDESRVIGCNGKLPWHLPEDMARFRALTQHCPVIMGRKTWESLPERVRPLPKRVNIVVTRHPSALVVPEGVKVCISPEDAVRVGVEVGARYVWVLGGAEVYRELLPRCEEVHVTHVNGSHPGDAWFPEFESGFFVAGEEVGADCTWVTYRRGYKGTAA